MFIQLIIIQYKSFSSFNVHWLWSHMHTSTRSSFISRQHFPEPQSRIFKSDQSFESVALSTVYPLISNSDGSSKQRNHGKSHEKTSQTMSCCFWLTIKCYSFFLNYSTCKFVSYIEEKQQKNYIFLSLRQASMQFHFPVCTQRCYNTQWKHKQTQVKTWSIILMCLRLCGACRKQNQTLFLLRIFLLTLLNVQ